jgi:steroid 5-alpha reductase family enzyme
MATISGSYAFNCYMANRFTAGIPADGFDDSSKNVGLLLFLAGQGINCYHHWLLAQLRTKKPDSDAKKQQRYVTPVGGLFAWVSAPHFLGELVAWYGLATLSQHAELWFLSGFMTSYLTGRAYATTQYYKEKIEDYPKERGHIWPFIF